MGNRLFFTDGGQIGARRFCIEFGFTTGASGTTSPTGTAIYNGSNVVASITYAATGKFNVVLSSNDFYNNVVFASAEMEDASSPDGAYCTIGNFAQEGTSNALTFTVTTFNSGGSAAAIANRRVWVSLTVRNTAMSSSSGGTP